jgi:hypothetical protein
VVVPDHPTGGLYKSLHELYGVVQEERGVRFRRVRREEERCLIKKEGDEYR